MTLDLQKLSAAKLWLISAPIGAVTPESPRDLAYLAQALYALVPVQNDEVARMTCDQWWRIYINAGWLDAASVREAAEELAHMLWHLLADHADRARSLGVDRSTADHWTRAADITVAHTLEPDRIRPDHLPTWRDTRLGPGCSAEEYFAALSRLPVPADHDCTDDPGPVRGAVGLSRGTDRGRGIADRAGGCGSGADGLLRHDEVDRDADLGAVDALEAREIRRRVAIEFRERHLGRGTIPGDLLRWVEGILEPETPWEPVLAAAVRRAVGWAAGRGDYTYARPSRRAGSVPGVVLPGQHRPVPRVSVIVDTSASVDDVLLQRALAEVDGVIRALGVPGDSITLYSVDAAVHTSERLRSAANARLIGAGGTDLRIGLAAIQAERPRPDVAIVFTDGDTPWPATQPPGTVVIVALLGRRRGRTLPPTPDWVIRVECLLDDRDGIL